MEGARPATSDRRWAALCLLRAVRRGREGSPLPLAEKRNNEMRTFVRFGPIIGPTSLGLVALGDACNTDNPQEPEPVARATEEVTQERPCQAPTTHRVPCSRVGRSITLPLTAETGRQQLAVYAAHAF